MKRTVFQNGAMIEGGILKAGIPEELVEDEMVRRVYLGQNFELRKKKIDFNQPH